MRARLQNMVSQTTLSDALIEAGLEASVAQLAAQVVAQVIEEEQGATTAWQAEMDERLDELLAAQKRLIDTRLWQNEQELRAINQRIGALQDSTEREVREVSYRIGDLRNKLI